MCVVYNENGINYFIIFKTLGVRNCMCYKLHLVKRMCKYIVVDGF